MLLAALALIAVQAQADPPPPPEIVVVGQRMKRIRLVTRTDRRTGAQRCIIRRSSGDAGLDTAICDAAIACGATAKKEAEMEACMQPRLQRIARGNEAR